MKKIYPLICTLLGCVLVSLLFTSCAKELDESSRTEAAVREIQSFLTQVGVLPEEGTYPEVVRELSCTEDPPKLISDSDLTGGPSDYYIRSLRRLHKQTKTALDDIPPTGIAGVIWPGALLQGRSIRDGRPTLVPIYEQRKPGRISLNVVSGDTICFFRDIPTFSSSNITQAMNDILAPYTAGFPANTVFSYQSVHTKEEMAYYLDMSPETFDATTQGAFDGVKWEKETSKIMVKLRQIFFTMVYDQPNIRDVFTNDVTPQDLARYSGEGNPIAYVSSVSYGRYFILLYESTTTAGRLHEAVSSAYVSPQEQASTPIRPQDRQILRKASVVMRQIGGNPEAGLGTITGDPEKIRKFIVEGATFSRDNVGEVVDYQVHYLCDNTILPVYRSLDVAYNVVDYRPEPKNNDVLLTIKGIRCMPLRQTAGNGHISKKSNFTVNPFSVTVYDEKGKVVKTFPAFNPGLSGVRTLGIKTDRFYNTPFDIGVLGENTKHHIVLAGSVFFYNRRTWSSSDKNGSSKWDSRTYYLRAEFRYNDAAKRWEVRYGSNPSPARFGDISLYDNLCSCALEFHLDFGFQANRVNY